MNSLLIKNARVVDCTRGFDQVADIAIEGEKIVGVGVVPVGFEPQRVIDATGLVATHGLRCERAPARAWPRA